jgi:hypothetical protein
MLDTTRRAARVSWSGCCAIRDEQMFAAATSSCVTPSWMYVDLLRYAQTLTPVRPLACRAMRAVTLSKDTS